MSPSYWKRLKAKRLERSRKGVAARLRKHLADHAGEPVRETRIVEITIRDSHHPRTVIRLEQHEGEDGKWSRWRGIGSRPLAGWGIGRILGRYLA